MNKGLKKNSKAKKPLPLWESPSVIFIVFGLLCFLTTLIMNGQTTKSLKQTISSDTAEIGPIEVKKDRSVLELNAEQTHLTSGQWNYVRGEVLDQNKNYLFSFGKELWAESGYDSDGPWQESDKSMSSKFTIQKAGTYYIRLTSENSQTTQTAFEKDTNIIVSVEQKRGSTLPHFVAGILSLIIGIGLYLIQTVDTNNMNWNNTDFADWDFD